MLKRKPKTHDTWFQRYHALADLRRKERHGTEFWPKPNPVAEPDKDTFVSLNDSVSRTLEHYRQLRDDTSRNTNPLDEMRLRALAQQKSLTAKQIAASTARLNAIKGEPLQPPTPALLKKLGFNPF